MEFERRKRVLLRTNIAPLVDVVFLLLLFFMVTSRIMVSPSIEVTLPESETADTTTTEAIVILVTAEGGLYIGDKQISMHEVESVLRRELTRIPDCPVTIRADEKISLNLLVKVIDEVKLAGATTFTIATERT